MAGEGAAPHGRRGHRGLGLFVDKGFFHRGIAGPGKRLDMGAEIAVRGPGQLFQPGEFKAGGGGQHVQRRHDSQAQRLVEFPCTIPDLRYWWKSIPCGRARKTRIDCAK
jgi:hypothetical protein